MSAPRSLRRLLVLAAAVPMMLAGCAQIPQSGPVVAGGAGDPDPREGIYQVIADGPQPGASPEELVTGFIRAAAGFGDDHSVARSFISDRSRLTWRPDARIDVFADEKDLDVTADLKAANGEDQADTNESDTDQTDPNEVAANEAEVTVKAPVSVEIDGDGRYTIAPPGTVRTEKFTLARVDGRWRISDLDDGILIVAGDFDTTFRPFPVYFPDPTGSYLIPDVHWFAAARDLPGSPEIPTALVRVLLQGPPKWLKGAVTTGAPEGTAMALGAVVVSDEVATVDLSSRALDANSQQRQMLVGQLKATLGQLRNIESVKITVRQVELETTTDDEPDNDPTATAGLQLRVDPQVGDQAVVVDKGRLAWLSGTSVDAVDDLDGLRLPGVNRPAVSVDRTTYAALDADRGRLLMQTQGAAKASQVVEDVQLSAPSFDAQGWVWTGPQAGTGTVYAGRTGAGTAKVSADWLKGKQMFSLRMSRDGARALVSVDDDKGRGHVFVAGVLRDPDGRPTKLTQPDGLIPDLSQVVDATWVDEDQIAVLGRREGKGQQVWLAQLGGPVTGRGGVPGAQSVTAGDGEGSLSIGSVSGSYSYLQRWRKASDARWPTYPG